MSPPLDVRARLSGAHVLVIGGTGFLGKVFWVMLLDRFPDLGRLTLMVRAGDHPGGSEARFWDSVVPSACLRPLLERHGDALSAFLQEKVHIVDGDVGRPLAGVDPAVVAGLRGAVDVVVNVAGEVDFDPPLDEALAANALGARHVVELARELGARLLHTSTCYVAGRRKELVPEEDPSSRPFPRIDEIDPARWDVDREIAECQELIAEAERAARHVATDGELRERTEAKLERRGEPTHGPFFEAALARARRRHIEDRLVEAGRRRAAWWGWPNIYTYTKSLGEQVVVASGLRCAVVRPACCEAALRFPSRGWTEGIGTSSPFVYLLMEGQVQLPASDVPLDLIPCDQVAIGMILALAELLDGSARLVYQLGSSDRNPITAERIGELIGLYKRRRYASGDSRPLLGWYKSKNTAQSVSTDWFEAMSSPAIARAARAAARLTDGVGPLAPGGSALRRLADREERISAIAAAFAPFSHDGVGPFSAENVRLALARLSPEERALLPWEPERIDWRDWMINASLPGYERWVEPELRRRRRRETRPHGAHRSLNALLDALVERHEHEVALQRAEDAGLSRVSYAELGARARACAARLAEAGAGPGDPVVLCAKNHPDWVIACFGVLRAGAVLVPVDADAEAPEIENILRDCGARLLITDAPAAERLRDLFTTRQRLCLHAVTAEDPRRAPPLIEMEPEQLASLVYTSGTTGSPKGVRLSHGNFTASIASLAPIFPLDAGDRLLSVLPLHHTFEFTCGLLLPLAVGARVLYLDELTSEKLADALSIGRVTAMVGVPAVWQLLERRILARVREQGDLAEALFEWGTGLNRAIEKRLGFEAGRLLFGPVHQQLGGHLRLLVSGGAALPVDTQKLYRGLGLHLTEGYGLTEAAPVLTVARPSRKASYGHVGVAVPGVTVRIADPDGDGVGEVVARGPNIMAGYTDEAATAAVIDEEGWLHTGDLGRLDGRGRLHIVGRRKDVIVLANGENVYPDDVEARLGRVEHVEELAIVGIGNRQGAERIACLGVPVREPGTRAERMDRASRALRAACATLPASTRPAVIHLVDAPLPRTATRKVRRAELRATLERLVAATAPPEEGAPASEALRQAIAAVSGRRASEILATTTLRDELGLDSLGYTELLTAVELRYGAVNAEALSRCDTVADLERLLAGRAPASSRTRAIEGRASPAGSSGVRHLPGPLRDLARQLTGRAQSGLLRGAMSAEVHGQLHIPYDRPTLVVANHASHLDMALVQHALGTYGEGLVPLAAEDYFFEGNALFRSAVENLTHLAPLDRKNLRNALRQAARPIEQGETVLLFPEGTRSPDGQIHPFKPLVGVLALTHRVDLLPIHLGGTFEAMKRGTVLPRARALSARIGPPLAIADLERLTVYLSRTEAARAVARLAQLAVEQLRDGGLLNLARMARLPDDEAERRHPLELLFEELAGRFRPGETPGPLTWYITLGEERAAKWTVRVDQERCEVRQGRPEGSADCVLKTSPDLFTRIVREQWTPGVTEFTSGAIKTSDLGLLAVFQRSFALA